MVRKSENFWDSRVLAKELEVPRPGRVVKTQILSVIEGKGKGRPEGEYGRRSNPANHEEDFSRKSHWNTFSFLRQKTTNYCQLLKGKQKRGEKTSEGGGETVHNYPHMKKNRVKCVLLF